MGQVAMVSAAQAAGLSAWQTPQGLGTADCLGEMNLNVWLRTLMSAMVCSIFGM